MLDPDEEITAKNEFFAFNGRLGECEVCGANEAKYTCPKCEVKTCCLKCVIIHKNELECDGIMDKARYIRIKNFTNIDLLSDYRLLEDISRTVYNNKKMLHTSRNDTGPNQLPLPLLRLRGAAHRRDTLLMFLPKGFSRRKDNSTYLDWKSQLIHWHIQWVFVNTVDNKKLVQNDQKCLETEKIGVILQKYFEPTENNTIINEKLHYYQSSGIGNVRLLLKAEGVPGNKYFELELGQTIQECLAKRIVIENPCVHVVLRPHCDAYNIISPDEEQMMLANDRHVDNPRGDVDTISSNIKSFDVSRKRQKGRNLLFITASDNEELSSDSDTEINGSIKLPRRK